MCSCPFCTRIALDMASRKAREAEQERYNREPKED